MASNQYTQPQRFGNYEHRSGKEKQDPKKNNLLCTYRKRNNHAVEKCYRLIGFPLDFKFTKSKKAQANAVMADGISAQIFNEKNGGSASGINMLKGENGLNILKQLSPDQCNQLIQVLRNAKLA
ncbi:hypothetical protein K7X08_014147 [Anisodus acutangulus]|uniref:Uncharacterized protein n=1 Tax=Anisodus acutangulus TaxID=402998 RepID=A0A9Q1LHW7_9SOLA|nr:hypothetical protein K7X08_014147 [Anisodus acutangulus]